MKTSICFLLITAITLIISLNRNAQTTAEIKPPSWVGTPVGSTKEGVTQALMNKYADIISKYSHTG